LKIVLKVQEGLDIYFFNGLDNKTQTISILSKEIAVFIGQKSGFQSIPHGLVGIFGKIEGITKTQEVVDGKTVVVVEHIIHLIGDDKLMF
jgi:hypothetical protein